MVGAEEWGFTSVLRRDSSIALGRPAKVLAQEFAVAGNRFVYLAGNSDPVT